MAFEGKTTRALCNWLPIPYWKTTNPRILGLLDRACPHVWLKCVGIKKTIAWATLVWAEDMFKILIVIPKV